MNLTKIANFRYSTKDFNVDKKIKSEDFQELVNVMKLSPSSINSQPWHFIVADNEEGKKRISKATQGFFSFNEDKILNASHVIVFTSKNEMNEDYLLHLLEKEEKDGRFAKEEHKQMTEMARSAFNNIHKDDLKDESHWLQKQVYLNMGVLLFGAAAMGIDALPMEGLDMEILNKEFGLNDKGLTAIAAVALGYRQDTDFNSSLPKSRLEEDETFTWI